MTIKEAALKYGTSVSMLRYYERLGIIPPAGEVDGKQRYRDEDCSELELLKCMSAADMPLDEMIEYAQLRKQGAITKTARLVILSEQRRRLIGKARALRQLVERMEREIVACGME